MPVLFISEKNADEMQRERERGKNTQRQKLKKKW